VKKGVEKFIRLSFASPLRHGSSQAQVSTLIGIETQPVLLSFTQEPPDTVDVNEVFLIKVIPYIKGGTPLESAVVKCNIT
jgi:hypothetical protein